MVGVVSYMPIVFVNVAINSKMRVGVNEDFFVKNGVLFETLRSLVRQQTALFIVNNFELMEHLNLVRG